jgi:hypothetical protein
VHPIELIDWATGGPVPKALKAGRQGTKVQGTKVTFGR